MPMSDPSTPDPHKGYGPGRTRTMALWFGISLAALLILSGAIYFSAQRADVASNPRAIESPATTGGASSSQ